MDVSSQKPEALLPTVSADELDQMLTKITERELSRCREPGLLVRSYGQLQGLDKKLETAAQRQYGRVYAVYLVGRSGTIAVDMSTKLAQGFQDGDHVEVIGFPTPNVYRGTLTFRLELVALKHSSSDAQLEQRRRDASNIAHLKSLKPGRNAFPLMDSIRVSVIHSRSGVARVDQDFIGGMGEMVERCQVSWLPVRITSAEEIAAAVSGCSADILVIIRGGGDEGDFSVFDDPAVLKALADCQSYRIVGVGHSANSTLADLVCDYSAAVPAAAGTHIRDQLQAMASTLGQLEAELNRKAQQVRYLQREKDSLQASGQRQPIAPGAPAKPAGGRGVAGYVIAAAVGAAAVWALLHWA